MAFGGNNSSYVVNIEDVKKYVEIFKKENEISIGLYDFTKEKATVISSTLNAMMKCGVGMLSDEHRDNNFIVPHMRYEHNMLKFKFHVVSKEDIVKGLRYSDIAPGYYKEEKVNNKTISYLMTSKSMIAGAYYHLLENMSAIAKRVDDPDAIYWFNLEENKKMVIDEKTPAFLYVDYVDLTVEYCKENRSDLENHKDKSSCMMGDGMALNAYFAKFKPKKEEERDDFLKALSKNPPPNELLNTLMRECPELQPLPTLEIQENHSEIQEKDIVVR